MSQRHIPLPCAWIEATDGCPSSLRYVLEGISQLRGPMRALDRLIGLIGRGDFADPSPVVIGRHERWILELRVADGLAMGATYQEIASIVRRFNRRASLAR